MAAVLLSAAGCKTAYYRTMETFGFEKRDLLVDRVEDARDSQEEAKEQFSSALERFTAVMDYDGGNLEKMYNRLQADFDRSEAKAENVHEEIDEVEEVAEDLFAEWSEELEQYSDATLRRLSEERLRDTQRRYEGMIRAMRAAETKMDPVLDAFRDQVLYLKHNLNARAIASLEDTATTLQSDIASLIAEMEASIEEANAFIDTIEEG